MCNCKGTSVKQTARCAKATVNPCATPVGMTVKYCAGGAGQKKLPKEESFGSYA
jgi:hypothetical protein